MERTRHEIIEEAELECDRTIEAGKLADDELKEKAADLEQFYAYYGMDMKECTSDGKKCASKFVTSLFEKLERFSCDPMDYVSGMQEHFILLLSSHSDPKLSLVATVLHKLKHGKRQ